MTTTFPSPDTPLYNHTLPTIETWLRSHGCEQDETNLHQWHLQTVTWSADLWMEVDSLRVVYLGAAEDGKDIQRSFKYSLSRQDLDQAIFSEP